MHALGQIEKPGLLLCVARNTWARNNFHILLRCTQYCSFPRAAGGEFCGAHVPGMAVGAGDAADCRGKRIPCPIDPRHTIFERDKDRHVKICNVATDEKRRQEVAIAVSRQTRECCKV
jgi:U11-48K-like CHHC zinc finger